MPGRCKRLFILSATWCRSDTLCHQSFVIIDFTSTIISLPGTTPNPRPSSLSPPRSSSRQRYQQENPGNHYTDEHSTAGKIRRTMVDAYQQYNHPDETYQNKTYPAHVAPTGPRHTKKPMHTATTRPHRPGKEVTRQLPTTNQTPRYNGHTITPTSGK